MKNIFAKFQEYVKRPKRNVFDLTFRNNLTLKFGELAPVFCKEVIPGDSFKIDTKFGLMMMPMKFPVQTPMKAYVHYFYVRNRTLWKDWVDFIGGTKENLVLPYVTPVDKQKFFRVGGLADYLGVPNVVYANESDSVANSLQTISKSATVGWEGSNKTVVYSSFVTTQWVDYQFLHYLSNSQYAALLNGTQDITQFAQNVYNQIGGTTAFSAFTNLTSELPNPWNAVKNYNSSSDTWQNMLIRPWSYLGRYNTSSIQNASLFVEIPFTASAYADETELKFPVILVYRNNNNVIQAVQASVETCVVTSDKTSFSFSVQTEVFPVVEVYTSFPCAVTQSSTAQTLQYTLKQNDYVKVSYGVEVNGTGVIGDGALTDTPFDSDIHLNALPFRAYESIYNAYYRNPQNNPFVLDGVPEYNRYITTFEGGADTTQYDLYFRNWEYDFLTSAVQSPQQGIAPLVGMSVTGEATFQDEEGNTFYAQALLNDSGEITGWQSHSSNMPVGSLRLLMDMAGTGISINDLRNVNAFQRFLENNIRHGLKYRDQIMSHFGVKVRYDELDMPEFIGGCSAEMEVYKVSQTSNSGDTPLGSFVGQAQVKKEFGHSITHYCDEHGYIIGIMSVVPVPVYSQLLPKHFVKSSQLDYYFPEFGHIGYQPILQKEVSPLQTFYSNNDLNKVFGYNRAWYDYLASTDEVHAQFRTTMKDFIMNRTFEDEPELSEEFLVVDPNQLNDVFLAGTDDDLYAPEADKIIGSLLFQVSAKRPIPLFGIPKLEG